MLLAKASSASIRAAAAAIYTYELPTSALIYESYGSHELYLAYGFDILKPKRTNRYKSVRYL